MKHVQHHSQCKHFLYIFLKVYIASARYIQWQWTQSFYKKLNIFIFGHLQQQTFPVNSHLPDTTLGTRDTSMCINTFLKLVSIPTPFKIHLLLFIHIVLHRSPKCSLYPVCHSQLLYYSLWQFCRMLIMYMVSICCSYSVVSWTKNNIQNWSQIESGFLYMEYGYF